jgi:Flp pilus assembly protein CpaB
MTQTRFSKSSIAGGILIALVAALVTASWYEYCAKEKHSGKVTDEQNATELVTIVCCADDIPAGTTIKRSQLQDKKVRLRSCPENVIDSVWVAVGRSIPFDKKKGDLVYLEDFGLVRKIPR